jgi:hypothetical protein
METCIEIDEFYKHPISKQAWSIHKKTKKVKYVVKQLRQGMTFGHEEML